MIRRILIIFFCFFALTLSARQVITGSLSNKETAIPVDGANVELLHLPDSSLIEATKSNSEGLFVFYKADTANLYCLRVKHLAFKILVMSVTPKKNSMINNVGAISLEPATFNLKEIVVNGSKVSVTELGDRTIYGIPDGLKKTSTDGLDVLRKVPAVQVDFLNEDITVNGKTNIKIEVDGVSRDKGYLKRLHPSQISKMEIITSPSGKYDADVDAVINIITNPAMRYGLKGTAYLGAFPISNNSYLGMANGSLDYGLEKISYYVSGNGMLQSFGVNSDMNRIAGTTNLQQNTTSMYKGNVGNFNAGFIYDPDELNDINFNIAYNTNSNTPNSNTWNFNSLNGNLSNILKTESNSKNNNSGLKSSLFYKHNQAWFRGRTKLLQQSE